MSIWWDLFLEDVGLYPIILIRAVKSNLDRDQRLNLASGVGAALLSAGRFAGPLSCIIETFRLYASEDSTN